MSAYYFDSLAIRRIGTYTKELDMIKNVIVEREVIARDNVDTGLLLYLPVGKTKTLAFGEQVLLGQLSAPVGFCCFLEVTVYSHTRETEDSASMISKVAHR